MFTITAPPESSSTTMTTINPELSMTTTTTGTIKYDAFTTAIRERNLQAQSTREEALFDLSMLDPANTVQITIIKHAPAKMVYGSEGRINQPVIENSLAKELWTARQKLRCYCSLMDEKKKVTVADETFKVVVIGLDCDEVVPEQDASNFDPSTAFAPVISDARNLLNAFDSNAVSFLQQHAAVVPAAPIQWQLPPQYPPQPTAQLPPQNLFETLGWQLQKADTFQERFGPRRNPHAVASSSNAISSSSASSYAGGPGIAEVDAQDALDQRGAASPMTQTFQRRQQDALEKAKKAHDEQKNQLTAEAKKAHEQVAREYERRREDVRKEIQNLEQRQRASAFADTAPYKADAHPAGHALFTHNPKVTELLKSGTWNIYRGADSRKDMVQGTPITIQRYGPAAMAKMNDLITARNSVDPSGRKGPVWKLRDQLRASAKEIDLSCSTFEVHWAAELVLESMRDTAPIKELSSVIWN
eukprot:Gregarina_sp_Poly_1__10976@NODE_867_length_5916_cov_55_659771_g627_i0_p1_GENE_NODE_867_length_5916_cov_55_659771_g627_i0NODE_867_length_5916_cov_55_659771_g627_i0_p1_ORF_typecomplete_len473_score76_23Clathrin_lg_ch/PF01086_17/1_4e05AAA_23/PF13476_6/0_0014Carbpep_Y_N/PF05388_11/0_0079Borrelia_P83/PF05262_11/0_011PLCbeta_C/PF08703_10/0_027HAUS6_N/PF14661_6/0_034Nup88/PF10168_9/0_059YjcZ/PF13990_6/0_11Plug/PF07715_15/0_12ELH/PF02323_15/31ELH/PF02323_15/11Atg14/PF10186_9/0_37DUF3584/PF12128_8/0_66DU